jgi:probable blue pigment (indigoidine) exporter
VARLPASAITAATFAVIIVAWGFNYLFVRVGLGLAAPLWLAFLRAGLGAVGVAVLWLALGRPRLSRRDRGIAAALGLLNTSLFFGLWFTAARAIAPGEAAVVVYSFPLWVALLSIPLLQFTLRPVTWLAIATGFVGIVLISQPWGSAGEALSPVPVAELLVGALSWALGTVLIQRRFAREAIQTVNLFQLLGGSAGLLVAAIVLEPGQLPAPSYELLGIVLWLGLVGTALGYGLWFFLLARIPAPSLSANMFLVPVVALVASGILLAERIDLVQVAGVVLVAGAIYAVGRWPPLGGARVAFSARPSVP